MSRTDKDRPRPVTRAPGPAPRWFVHATWWGPQRARARDRLRDLAREYNTRRQVDDDREPAPVQHRHGAVWHWW